MADDRIIVALDVHSLEDLKKLVETLGDRVSFYKVGIRIFIKKISTITNSTISYLNTHFSPSPYKLHYKFQNLLDNQYPSPQFYQLL